MACGLKMASVMRFLPLVLCALAACEPPGYGNHADAATDGTPHGDAPPAVDAAVDAGANTCSHVFSIYGHGGATAVFLTGDFIAWADPNTGAQALALGNDGGWSGTRQFDAGSYQYKFIVDGTYLPDPTNPDQVDDGFGGHNSVYSCVP